MIGRGREIGKSYQVFKDAPNGPDLAVGGASVLGEGVPGAGGGAPPDFHGPSLPAPRPGPRTVTGNLSGRVIVVNAGHGGHDPGALGRLNVEKNACLEMARALRRGLEARGARVVMTRDLDSFVSLDERCAIANGSGADLFISIHCNSSLHPNSGSGSQRSWRTPQSLQLAQTLHPYLAQAVGRRDAGIHNASFCVIRETTMPSVLLEVAYINNETDEKLLFRPDFRSTLAESVANGVVEYFQTER